MSQSSHYAQQFQAHRSALTDLYAQLPEDQANFSAWDGGMSFIGLADHLSGSAGRLVGMTRQQAPGEPLAPSASLAEARERLIQTQAEVAGAIAALSDEDLKRRMVGIGGQEMAVSDLLEMLITHEAHHKGQVWLMARMVGVKPGRYVKMN